MSEVKEVKVCKCCGKELSKTNKSGYCKECYSKQKSSNKEVIIPEELKKFTEGKALIATTKTWGSKEKTIFTCPDCGERIWNPGKDKFCWNCGQKFDLDTVVDKTEE